MFKLIILILDSEGSFDKMISTVTRCSLAKSLPPLGFGRRYCSYQSMLFGKIVPGAIRQTIGLGVARLLRLQDYY